MAVLEVERNVKVMYTDYKYSKISKYIYSYKHKYSEKIIYSVSVFKRSKVFKTLKEAQKYVDLVLLENNKPQIYNSYKAK